MIFVDSCVWIDFFNGVTTPAVELLSRQTGRDRLITGDLVLTEVLQGFPMDRAYRTARDIMLRFQIVIVSDPRLAIEAADNYRILRKRGISVRKTIDTLIATRCIHDDWSILTSDRDFAPFVEHFGLRDAMAEA